MTQTESDFLAFVNYVIGETHSLACQAGVKKQDALAVSLLGLCSVAGKKHRELLGLPEPDPDVDYDEDYHAAGTQRLNGEPRREKGEAFSDSLDLSALTQNDGKE